MAVDKHRNHQRSPAAVHIRDASRRILCTEAVFPTPNHRCPPAGAPLRRNLLSLRVARWIVTAILPAGLLSAGLVCRLLLASFVLDDALLRARSILWPWHPGLAAVFPAHVLTPFKIVRLRHCSSPR